MNMVQNSLRIQYLLRYLIVEFTFKRENIFLSKSRLHTTNDNQPASDPKHQKDSVYKPDGPDQMHLPSNSFYVILPCKTPPTCPTHQSSSLSFLSKSRGRLA
jgi:hypothetical protein